MTAPHNGNTPAREEGGAHTPGPWSLDYELLEGSHILVFGGDYGIAKVYDQEAGARATNEANAHLIAAAPEHDECLWNAVALFEPLCRDEAQMVWLEQAKATLAKARGQ